jgi:cytosine/adenosine deaminase-related metal-dependent hydrolase
MSVVWCPRTHAAFGHPPHPFRRFLEQGVNVALGTDSLASSPDLSILNEARFLYRSYPNAEILLRMITVNGALALGLAELFGSLQIGRPANLTVIAIPHGSRSPVRDLFATSGEVIRVITDGTRAK